MNAKAWMAVAASASVFLADVQAYAAEVAQTAGTEAARVPEPSSAGLFGIGLACIAVLMSVERLSRLLSLRANGAQETEEDDAGHANVFQEISGS